MASMKKFMILTGLLGISVAGLTGVIFSLDLFFGWAVAALVMTGSLLLFGFSCWGIGRGGLPWIGLGTITETAALLCFSVYVGVAAGMIGAANTAVEVMNEGDHTAGNKLRLFARDVLQLPISEQKAALERNGVRYVYPLEWAGEIDKMEKVLREKTDSIHTFYGMEPEDMLTVEFHSSYESLENASFIEETAGYYDFESRSVHLVPDDPAWELILLHEYTHFMSHQYALSNDVSETRLPQWFEEGLADYFGGEDPYWYDPASLETVEFFKLDLNSTFHEEASVSFDPYAQSFLAVHSLAEDYGEEGLQMLLDELSPQRFYMELKKLTGKDLDEFQATFLEDEIAESRLISDLFDTAYSHYENGEFDSARQPLEEILAVGGSYDTDQALWMLTDIHLELGEYSEAASLLEEKLETGLPEFRMDDLLLLAEVYTLIDPAKSAELAREVRESAETDAAAFDYYAAEADSLAQAYQSMADGNEEAGLRQLMEEGILYNAVVLQALEEKFGETYPDLF